MAVIACLCSTCSSGCDQLEIFQSHIRYWHDELHAIQYRMMASMESQIMRSESSVVNGTDLGKNEDHRCFTRILSLPAHKLLRSTVQITPPAPKVPHTHKEIIPPDLPNRERKNPPLSYT
jgi:hypothetical protein